jgi:hypothetical protein
MTLMTFLSEFRRIPASGIQVRYSIKKMPSRSGKTSKRMLLLLFLLAYAAARLPIHALGQEEQPLDLVPFALPGTPANEVRFEEPREIREVIVTLKSAVPDDLGLSYLHKTWRRKRQELLDPTIGSFQLGWKVVDDWFDVSWDKGAIRVEKTGPRTAALRFGPLSKEGVSFTAGDVDYRYTLGVRVNGVTADAIEHIAVYTASKPTRTKIRVMLDAGMRVDASEIKLSGYNSTIVNVAAEEGTKRLGGDHIGLLEVPPMQRRFLADIRHLVSPHRLAHDEGLITFELADKTFTISMDSLLAQGPIWHEDGGAFVTLASDPTSFDAYLREVQRRGGPSRTGEASGVPAAEGSIASMVRQMPEQSLSGARLGQPERHPVAMMLGCKYNQNRFRIETDGDITMENGYGSEQAHRFFFGMGRWSRVANYTDAAPALIYHVERRSGDLRVHQETFVVPLRKPVGEELGADEPTVCLVRFTLRNEGHLPITAALPIEFSSRSQHTRHPYQDGARSGVPAGPRDALTLTNYPGAATDADGERLLMVAPEGRSEVRGTIRTSMSAKTTRDGLVLHHELAPGGSVEVLMKVARKAIATEPDRALLARLQFEPLRDQTARFWNDLVSPWAELKTPEPELNAFHKAHLAHQMISDHRMPGEDGLISTSVGSDAYGNYGNESTMVIQELEERGLHEDARKRLTLWLKYQGTAKLAGRFSEQEGVFFGSGGTEAGESYVQSHGWILWALAEHYFMTRDKAWLGEIAPNLLRGAEWIVRQRRLTMGDQPLSRGWERGLLPPGGLEDVNSFFYWVPSNSWNWWGMNHVADALEAIGHPEASRLRAEADAYRADILRCLTIARQHNPLVRLRDGRWVPHYPTHVYRRGRELGWIRETLEGSVNLLLCGILDPNGPEARWILDDYQDNLYAGGEFGYPIPDFHETWYDWAGFSCQPNLLAGLMPYLDRDDIEVYIWMFFNAFSAAYSPNIQGVVEHPRPVLGFSNAEPFKTSDESNSIKWLRYMFVYGKGDTLHLGRALPREWLSRGESIYLKRVHTRFGVVSVEYDPDLTQSRITCKADLALKTAPARMLVRFRHPDKKPIQSVRVNGLEHIQFDPVKGDVDVSGKIGVLKIEALYAPLPPLKRPQQSSDHK